MIVEKLEAKANGKNIRYICQIDGIEYSFSEDVILEYRLVKGKEINQSILDEAVKKNNLSIYYDKALNYAYKYSKNSVEVYDYLLNKGLVNNEIAEIIDKLKRIKIIDDEKLVKNLASYYARSGNGRLMISKKLYERKFNDSLIDIGLSSIDEDEYYKAMLKIYQKASLKYKSDNYNDKMKLKRYILQRGYSIGELNYLINNYVNY